jgi:7-keto-8-aminopelargonate synthetase-like enzyme
MIHSGGDTCSKNLGSSGGAVVTTAKLCVRIAKDMAVIQAVTVTIVEAVVAVVAAVQCCHT